MTALMALGLVVSLGNDLFAAEELPPSAPSAQGHPVPLDTTPIRWNPNDRNDLEAGELAGELEWAGGIKITSANPDFGGWSGLSVSADGSTLVAVSDTANWLSAQILYDEKGRLSGLADAAMAPLLDLKGKPIGGKVMGDAEGLTITGSDPLKGDAYVSFERLHRVWRYALGEKGFLAVPSAVVTQRRLGEMPGNGGIEALAIMPPETGGDEQKLLALSEDARDAKGRRRAFLIEDRNVERLSTKLDEPFSPTDVARLPNGDFLMLERSFSLLAGPGMQMRLIKADEVKADAMLEGRVLMSTNNRRTIDNMEGLAVREITEGAAKGQVLVYVISDDNFNPLQNTYLMMFRYQPLAPPMSELTLPQDPAKVE
jgi:hypothetical protein